MAKTTGLKLNNHRGEKICKNLAVLLSSFLLAFTFASIFTPPQNSSASQEVQATLSAGNYYVSVSAEPTVSLTVGARDFGSVVSTTNNLSASTNIPSGFQIYFSTGSDIETSNRLYLNGDTTAGYLRPNTDLETGDLIPASSPASLGSNMWGYTTDSSNVTNNLWGAVPTLGNDEIVASESAAGEYTETVYLGVKASMDMHTGNYTGTLAYTIIADAPIDPMNPIEISPTSGYYLTPVEIKATLADASTTLEDLGTITATISGEECTNPTYAIDAESSVLTINCNTPKLSTKGLADVKVSIARFGKTYTLENGYNYNGLDIRGLTYMQDMTGEICSATEEGVTARLIDKRGRGNAGQAEDASYGVIKAKDGNCWMTENFDLYNKSISYTESDFTSGTFTIPDNTTGSPSGGDDTMWIPYVYRRTISYEEENYDVSYYSWCSAVALAYSSCVKVTGVTTQNTSICPKNWRLPLADGATTNKSYQKLFTAYGATSQDDFLDSDHAAYALGYHIKYGSHHYGQNITYTYFLGAPWSAISGLYYSYSYSAKVASIASSINYDDTFRPYGNIVRCVSRD